MIRKRFAIFLTLMVSLLAGMAVADEGQFLILNAQYGNERNHVDVTARLKELARRDLTFRVSHDSMAVDPAEGRSKMLRVFARDQNGQERFLDFPDGSIFDGGQFRAFRGGGWGDEHWNGGWQGRANADQGNFLILSAQYGSERHHVDVTNQLKQLARADVRVRLDYRTFGVDPDEGHSKVLRIYARGPNGRERMFEYRDGMVIDGTQFRGWGRGEWGGDRDRWSGRWEGEEREEHEHERDRQ